VPGSGEALRLLLRSRTFLHSSAGFGGCFMDARLVDTELAPHFLRPIASSARCADGYRRYLRGFDWNENDRMAERHRGIGAPTLFVWGRNDPTFPEALGRDMSEQFPHVADFFSIARTRLLPHVEAPARVLARLLPFLTGEAAQIRSNGARPAPHARTTRTE
jgi:pimeloyl-ACP methyl ester carboxylesterase